jgi:hypothetical protein
MLKIAMKAIIAAAAVCTVAAPAFAYTLNGTVPAGGFVVINLHKPLRPGPVQFVFSAPPGGAGAAYALDYCVGRNAGAKTCQIANMYSVVQIVPGQTATVSFPYKIFSTNVLVVEQGTSAPVPYSVEVTQ